MARRRSSEPSNQAQAATMIRKTLKAAYPGVTFRVRSDGFSMGDSVDVEWTDGPTTAEVEPLIRAHEQGHFDGMDDLYHYSNSRDDIPQTKYLHCDRHMSNAAYHAIVAYLNQRFGWELRLIERTSPAWRKEPARTFLELDRESDKPLSNGGGWQSHEIHRHFVKMSLLCGHCAVATLPGDLFCPACGLALTPRDHLAVALPPETIAARDAAEDYADALADNPPPAPGMRWDAGEGADVPIVCPGCASDPCHCDTLPDPELTAAAPCDACGASPGTLCHTCYLQKQAGFADHRQPPAWDVSPSMAAYDGGRYRIEGSGLIRLI